MRIWLFILRHNIMQGNQGCGVQITGWDGFVTDNQLSGNGSHGFACDSVGATVTFTANRVEWNKGYGTEAMTLLQRHGFETLNLNRLSLKVYAENARAIRAYEKAGFVQEGRMRSVVYKHGRYDDVILMSVLRSEWMTPKEEK